MFQLLGKSQNADVIASARAALKRIAAPTAYPCAEVDRIEKLVECLPTALTVHPVDDEGRLTLKARVAGNGLNILVIENVAKPRAGGPSG